MSRRSSSRGRSRSAPAVRQVRRVQVAKRSSLARLSKRVRFNSQALHGQVQTSYQELSSHLTPIATRPLCFDSTDFSRERTITGVGTQLGCQVYQFNTLGTAITAPAQWRNNAAFAANPLWQGQNLDFVSGGSYLPMFAKYTFRVEGIPTIDNTRVRIDLVSLKMKAFTQQLSGSNTLILPHCLINMQNLANPTLNKLPPSYYRVWKTKYMYLNSQPSLGTNVPHPTTGNIKYCTFKIRPKKVKTQNLTVPATQDSILLLPSHSPYGPGQSPLSNQLFFIISCDDRTIGDLDAVHVNVSRYLVWRDSDGRGPQA